MFQDNKIHVGTRKADNITIDKDNPSTANKTE